MCLLSKQDIYTADSDIMCYKVGKVSRNGIISPCELFFFEFDKLYTDQKPEMIHGIFGKTIFTMIKMIMVIVVLGQLKL